MTLDTRGPLGGCGSAGRSEWRATANEPDRAAFGRVLREADDHLGAPASPSRG
jgi:hypothetical protein